MLIQRFSLNKIAGLHTDVDSVLYKWLGSMSRWYKIVLTGGFEAELLGFAQFKAAVASPSASELCHSPIIESTR